MFFKLMLDSLKIRAKHYLADRFRFDLMGFSFKNNMLEIKEALREIRQSIFMERVVTLVKSLITRANPRPIFPGLAGFLLDACN